MSDLVERLRRTRCNKEPFTASHADCICLIVSEAADEIERLRSQPGWLPIKTAPKAGESILGAVSGAGAAVIMKWVKTPRGGRWVAADEEDFRDMEDWADYVATHDFPATHWQPLPIPPEKESKE